MSGLTSAVLHLGKLLQALEKLNVTKRIEQVEIVQTIQSLREIFFLPSEVKAELEKISAGEVIDADEASEWANEFDEMDAELRKAMEFLDPHRFEQNMKLSTPDIEFLDEVRIGKIGVRFEISSFFRNYAYERTRETEALFATKQKARAKEILRQINELNKDIGAAEAALKKASRGQ